MSTLTTYQQSPTPQNFADLITTHINLVYSVARRTTKDDHLAEDITQEVFLLLSRKAKTIDPATPLAGWLFTTTRLLSLQTLRAKSRRQKHESEAAMSQQHPATPDPLWPLIAEEIDQAIADLPPVDRDALLLRYFNHHSTSEIATLLAITEEAAKKRTQRALDALQKLLTSRGFATTTALALATALTAHAVHAAPPTLAASITTKSVAALAAKGTLMATAKLKATLLIAATLTLITIPTAIYLSPHNPAPVSATSPAEEPPTDYLDAYALKPDQYLAVIPNVPPALRDALYQEKNPFRNLPKQTPRTMVLQWQNNQLSIQIVGDSDFSISSFIPFFLDVYSFEYISRFAPTGTADLRLPPDIVFRQGGTPEQYLADLQTICTDHFNHPVFFTFAQRLMDAVVLSGNYHFTHAVNAHNAVHFYLHNVDIASPDKPPQGGACDQRTFCRILEQYLGKPVVIDSSNFPKQIFHNEDTDAPCPLPAADVPLLLQHITEQTALTVTYEKRPIRFLNISDGPVPPAPNWKGWTLNAYPAVSPFQALRWNGDFPEVQLNNTWYQLLTLNHLYADQLITAAKSADKDWQRHFAEDLPALLAYLGHDPGPTPAASLELKDLNTGKILPLENIPFTKENRDAIRNALATPQSP